jgi:hypothetical protein
VRSGDSSRRSARRCLADKSARPTKRRQVTALQRRSTHLRSFVDGFGVDLKADLILFLLTVSSAVGLVLIHMATIKPWAEKFHREPLARRALQRHITALLLDGLCRKRTKSKRISKHR